MGFGILCKVILSALLCLCFCPGGTQSALRVIVPSPVTVELGSDIIIPCSYEVTDGSSATSSSSPVTLQWLYEEKGTDGRTSPQRILYKHGSTIYHDNNVHYYGRVDVSADLTLTVRQARLEDARTFTCEVVSPHGTNEAHTTVNVFGKPTLPKITANSLPILANTLEQIATCTSSNAFPEPVIVWYKDVEKMDKSAAETESAVQPDGLFSVTSKLRSRPSRADRDSLYYCELLHWAPGKGPGMPPQQKLLKSAAVNVTVHYPPQRVTLVVEPATVKEGDSVVMECSTDGNPQPSSFEFYRVFEKEERRERLTTGVRGARLTVPAVQRSDSGVYACTPTVTPPGQPGPGLTADRKALYVHFMGEVAPSSRAPVVVPRGGTLAVWCTAEASTTLVCTWVKNDQVLLKGFKLRKQNVGYTDMGVYTCVCTLEEVPDLSRNSSVQVLVEGPPALQGQPSTCVDVNESLELACTMQGFPRPHVMWSITGSQSEEWEEQNALLISRLAVSGLEPAQQEVTCNASNRLGTEGRRFTLSRSCQYQILSSNNLPLAECSSWLQNALVLALAVGGALLLALVVVVVVLVVKLKRRRGRAPPDKTPRTSNNEKPEQEPLKKGSLVDTTKV
ncbi:CD166 antigen-like isoform X1 [Lethenteron reissneri]|uniref:CD166 antigen-like isoform X1 n=1 Tax=Lethenteron reissneri TaxID=7753 RepID=UPI002AB6A8D4|nr:CD166 antigen-like isoform X1 [Lethenteron reissneri]